jgi:2-octaprenyl-6-methoxyphenol hydroxylase
LAETTESDIAVVGAGPAGLAAALALAHIGARTVLIGPPPTQTRAQPRDTRTAALLASSVDLLKALGVWEALAPHSAPLKAIRIIDASGGLFRSPDIKFEASELGLPAFGYNIANDTLTETLYARAVERLHAVAPNNVAKIELGAEAVRLHCSEGPKLTARLVVGADGRRSICRAAASIEVSEWRYDQKAIAASFTHARPHDNISTELHRRAGSLTAVPLIDAHASSLVWVGATAEIDALMQLDASSFAEALEARLGGILGKSDGVGPRAAFPVAGLTAKSMAGHRTALVGEAAHILPPIGAQGLNLGLRDAAALADCVAAARARGADPGASGVLDAYAQSRKLDVFTRAVGVDLLNRSLLTGFLPLQAARGIVLSGLNALPGLRRLVMRIGMAPPTALPSLMRPMPGR